MAAFGDCQFWFIYIKASLVVDMLNIRNVEVIKELAGPIKLSKGKSRLLQFSNRLGLGDSMFWNMMLKKVINIFAEIDPEVIGSISMTRDKLYQVGQSGENLSVGGFCIL